MMKNLLLLVPTVALTACGWAANAPSEPAAFSGETLTAVTVTPFYDRICGARSDATVLCVDASPAIADPDPVYGPLGNKVVTLPAPAVRLVADSNAVCALLGDASVCVGPGHSTRGRVERGLGLGWGCLRRRGARLRAPR